MEEAAIKRVMPHDTEAEQAVIGSMLMDKDAILEVSEVLTGQDFYEPAYGVMFDAIMEIYNEGKSVDVVTLQAKLKDKDVSPEIASMEYVGGLVTMVPTSANARSYANIVAEKAIMRRLIRIDDEISNLCYTGQEPLPEILDKTESKVFDLLQSRTGEDYVPIDKIVMDTLDRIEEAAKTKGAVTGIPTGFMDLDYMLSGLQPADLILIAARPSMGKTALALNIAQYVAFKKKMGVAVFSLEMTREQLMNRLLALESNVDVKNIRTGNLSTSEWQKLVEGAGIIGSSDLIIDDTPGGVTVSELRSKCRKYKLENDVQLIIVDYLQLMSGSAGQRFENRQQEITEISRSLKALARELNVPVIALSQLSRAPESRPDKRPMLSDLRESGAIEQDADVVMFLYRDEYYNPDTEDKNQAEVIVAKQRNGPVGTVNLAWLPQYTKFASLSRQE